MKFYTDFDRPPKVMELGGGPCLVDKAGYVSAFRRIQEIVNAGYRLRLSRISEYDFPSEAEIDDTFEDLSRRPGFDLAEASMIMENLKAKLKAKQEAEAEAKPKAQASGVKPDNEPKSPIS